MEKEHAAIVVKKIAQGNRNSCNDEKLRLFFALWPDEKVRQAMHASAKQLQEHCAGSVMRPETLHMTLLFMGAVPSGRLMELQSVAATVHADAFGLVLDGLGAWLHARVVYMYPIAAQQGLTKLVGKLRNQVAHAGFDFDNKPFVPHVTLVRKAGSMPKMNTITPFTWRIDKFCLVRSVLSDMGACYEIQGSWPLSSD